MRGLTPCCRAASSCSMLTARRSAGVSACRITEAPGARTNTPSPAAVSCGVGTIRDPSWPGTNASGTAVHPALCAAAGAATAKRRANTTAATRRARLVSVRSGSRLGRPDARSWTASEQGIPEPGRGAQRLDRRVESEERPDDVAFEAAEQLRRVGQLHREIARVRQLRHSDLTGPSVEPLFVVAARPASGEPRIDGRAEGGGQDRGDAGERQL